MPFPPFTYCIICEAVRPEMGGKITILGFFGLTPNVDIAVGRLDQPLTVSIIIGFGAVEDANQYEHTIQVLNPDGTLFFGIPQARINTIRGRGGALVTGATVIPRVPGPRTVNVTINGEVRLAGQFTIRQATPQELAGLPGAPVH